MSVYEQLDSAMCPKRRTRRLCAEAFGIEEYRLVGSSRVREVVIPRHATYYVLRARFPEMSFPWIGRFMGGRDHSTILHGIRAIKARMERDQALRQVVHSLVNGRLPEQHDAHMVAWRSEISARMLRHFAAPAEAVAVDGDSELAAFVTPDRTFCEQCDRSVTFAEAARCGQRLCGLRRAA